MHNSLFNAHLAVPYAPQVHLFSALPSKLLRLEREYYKNLPKVSMYHQACLLLSNLMLSLYTLHHHI